MFELHYWPTPNNHKVTLFLEEAGLEYRLIPVDIQKSEQMAADFLKISPNNKVPALVDPAPRDGGEPLSIFESGAILQYLARKTGRFYPENGRARAKVDEWLFWQMAGLGPMTGQLGHFTKHAHEKVPYAIKRYHDEVLRLLKVFNQRLEGRAFLADEYSIADMACYPWITLMPGFGIAIEAYPNLSRWSQAIAARPATARAFAKAREFTPQ